MFTESYTCTGIAEVMMVRLYFSYNFKNVYKFTESYTWIATFYLS